MEKRFLERAIALAAEKSKEGAHGPFGAVVALNDTIVGEGFNQVVETIDPTAHAEIVAIRMACKRLGRFDLSGCVLYTSCEPCPMCLSAIYWSRIATVVYASTKKDAERAGFDDDFIYRELALPQEKRRIRFIRAMGVEANQVFDTWISNPGKLPY